MSKHTEGPWQVGDRHTQNGVYSAGGRLIANTHSLQSNSGWEAIAVENDANARLISAAPDMLEALREVNALISEGAEHGFQPLVDDFAERIFASQRKTYAAISKATLTRKEDE